MEFYFWYKNKNIIRNPMLFFLKLSGRISKKLSDRSFVEGKIHLIEKLMES